MKYIFMFILFFLFWMFANGFLEMASAPDHYTSCQAIEWAQEENKNKFRPDEVFALWILKSIKCDSASTQGYSKSYITDQFKDGSSRTPVMYMCAVTGQKEGFDPKAIETLASVIQKTNLNHELSKNLMTDAITWYKKAKGNYDFEGFWVFSCEKQFENIRFLYSK